MPVPLFPSLNPKLTDSLWFNVDKAIDEEAELTLIEQEHTTWLNNVTNEDYELIPIGKTASELTLRNKKYPHPVLMNEASAEMDEAEFIDRMTRLPPGTFGSGGD
uniref:Uncharacterized protein n=1 Tax=Timema bartmani TaxID=61472 RepID=A0A7R9FC32_9NEOP|nr:unnamed protein product [Timema bartmani]